MISIAQAVSYELTDDRILKAVLLDNDGNEHESELRIDDYLVLDDYQSPYFKFEERNPSFQKGIGDVRDLRIFIHKNRKWGPMLCINYAYGQYYNRKRRLNMSESFWNNNGTLCLNYVGDQRRESIPYPDKPWQLYWADSKDMEMDIKRHGPHNALDYGIMKAYSGYEDENDVEYAQESIYDYFRGAKEKKDTEEEEDSD